MSCINLFSLSQEKPIDAAPLHSPDEKLAEQKKENLHTEPASVQCEVSNVGGQAVIEGIMMRSKDAYALAVRLPDLSIHVERKRWYAFTQNPLYKKAFFRGFPLLVETLINGVKTLNRSAELNSKEDEAPLTKKQLLFTLLTAAIMAIGLFILIPHALSVLMQFLGYSKDVESFSFQVWDGVFKFLIFFSYLAGISFLPDIRRVFQFHGAEHKVIAAYENCPEGRDVDINLARIQSRFHPRCGTTFLLFVLSIAILTHALFLPPLLWFFAPQSEVLKHIFTLCIKIVLIIPISAIAYELIRYASKGQSLCASFFKVPGLLLQRFTTKEPEDEHLEVALVALKVALGEETKKNILTTNYTVSE